MTELPFWRRRAPAGSPHLPRELKQRYELAPLEIGRVERAVVSGHELDDPRLRAAVVDWAQRHVAAGTERTGTRGRLPRWALAGLLVWAVGLGGLVVVSALTGEWAGAPWITVLAWTPWVVLVLRRLGGPERAIRRNSECPPDDTAASHLERVRRRGEEPSPVGQRE
ncbi:hypothetical protein [Modestobacter italicus]|uniref:hypothetical protein n=1 Tax=Modestobacter italicus (strain DSM 44449 / CECT 9708 / BC 501) TaxID=2732864 RepID=UPI001C9440BF|nr:hypothetical protein [Modestobacter italicus]